MKKYRATLFHPEGDFISDFHRDTIDEVWDAISDAGSKWFFYPIPFVTTKTSIVSLPFACPDWMKRKHIKTIQKYLRHQWAMREEEITNMINEGYPLILIYYDKEGL
jgi:hypothetical protein